MRRLTTAIPAQDKHLHEAQPQALVQDGAVACGGGSGRAGAAWAVGKRWPRVASVQCHGCDGGEDLLEARAVLRLAADVDKEGDCNASSAAVVCPELLARDSEVEDAQRLAMPHNLWRGRRAPLQERHNGAVQQFIAEHGTSGAALAHANHWSRAQDADHKVAVLLLLLLRCPLLLLCLLCTSSSAGHQYGHHLAHQTKASGRVYDTKEGNHTARRSPHEVRFAQPAEGRDKVPQEGIVQGLGVVTLRECEHGSGSLETPQLAVSGECHVAAKEEQALAGGEYEAWVRRP